MRFLRLTQHRRSLLEMFPREKRTSYCHRKRTHRIKWVFLVQLIFLWSIIFLHGLSVPRREQFVWYHELIHRPGNLLILDCYFKTKETFRFTGQNSSRFTSSGGPLINGHKYLNQWSQSARAVSVIWQQTRRRWTFILRSHLQLIALRNKTWCRWNRFQYSHPSNPKEPL